MYAEKITYIKILQTQYYNKDVFKNMNNLILLEYSAAINVIHTPVASKNGADFISGSHSLED